MILANLNFSAYKFNFWLVGSRREKKSTSELPGYPSMAICEGLERGRLSGLWHRETERVC